jgi:ferritin-like metal-binding protein YciE
MDMESLRDLYIDELKDLYSAETQLVKALPKMAKNATHPELKQAFTDHLEQTKGHVARLDEIFAMLEASPRGKKCVGMEGLIEEAKELLEEDAEEEVLDAGLISKAQHVEHYEMAGYGTVRTYATILGETEQAQLLQQTLDEEGEADKLLTQLAESSVNVDAASGDDAEDSENESATRGGRGDREVQRNVASDSRASTGRATSGRTTNGRAKGSRSASSRTTRKSAKSSKSRSGSRESSTR